MAPATPVFYDHPSKKGDCGTGEKPRHKGQGRAEGPIYSSLGRSPRSERLAISPGLKARSIFRLARGLFLHCPFFALPNAASNVLDSNIADTAIPPIFPRTAHEPTYRRHPGGNPPSLTSTREGACPHAPRQRRKPRRTRTSALPTTHHPILLPTAEKT